MRVASRWRGAALALPALLVACSPATEEGRGDSREAVALADQEDAVCGMLVREQSAPRAQVLYRDDERFFFCSMDDLLVHLSAPSPHGRVQAIFVEVMDPDEDPARSHTAPHPWLPADRIVYVVGIPRRGIMGEPVLTYRDEASARRAMRGHEGASALDLEGLKRWWTDRQAHG
jgi:nitrous oxide reductase accessory protein NosL